MENELTGLMAIHLRRVPFMEDHFMRRADLRAFQFGADKTLRARYNARSPNKKVVYVHNKFQPSDEARLKLHFQVSSIPPGFHITDGYPEWNEETRLLTATRTEACVKAAIHLEEQEGANQIILVVAVKPGAVGTVGSATYLQLRIVRKDVKASLKQVCKFHNPLDG